MYDEDERPLGGIAESAYQVLLHTGEIENGIQRSDAHTCLVEVDFVDDDAEYALSQLLNRGYLYAVDNQLFVTDAGNDTGQE
jgi:hypothetical protein